MIYGRCALNSYACGDASFIEVRCREVHNGDAYLVRNYKSFFRMNRMFYIAAGFSDEYLANQMLFITKFRGPVTEREGE